ADHSTIFLFIAGTFTPFAVLSHRSTWSWTLLVVVWVGGMAGIAVVWTRGIHPGLSVLYVTLGWMGLLLFPHVIATVGVPAAILLMVGGLCYTAGAAASLTNRPNPWPRVFGYHEVFHLLTIVAAVCQYSAVAL